MSTAEFIRSTTRCVPAARDNSFNHSARYGVGQSTSYGTCKSSRANYQLNLATNVRTALLATRSERAYLVSLRANTSTYVAGNFPSRSPTQTEPCNRLLPVVHKCLFTYAWLPSLLFIALKRVDGAILTDPNGSLLVCVVRLWLYVNHRAPATRGCSTSSRPGGHLLGADAGPRINIIVLLTGGHIWHRVIA